MEHTHSLCLIEEDEALLQDRRVPDNLKPFGSRGDVDQDNRKRCGGTRLDLRQGRDQNINPIQQPMIDHLARIFPAFQ
jgi:hypothetical protein